jgi:hypothetical protein
LEDGDLSDAHHFREQLFEFMPPRRHGPMPCAVLVWTLEKRDAIATLPEGVVSSELRKVLDIEPSEAKANGMR